MALSSIGERESGTARLEQAAAAFRAALEENIRERVPVEWARTHINLGNALLQWGSREGGTARLEEAVTAYRAALEENTVPFNRTTALGMQGLALKKLAQRTNDARMALEAELLIRLVSEEMRTAGHPLAADFQAALDTSGIVVTSPPTIMKNITRQTIIHRIDPKIFQKPPR